MLKAKMQALGCPCAVVSGCAIVNLGKRKTWEAAQKTDLGALYRELEIRLDQEDHIDRLFVKTLRKAL